MLSAKLLLLVLVVVSGLCFLVLQLSHKIQAIKVLGGGLEESGLYIDLKMKDKSLPHSKIYF